MMRRTISFPGMRVCELLAAGVLSLGLAGCVETLPQMQASAAQQQAATSIAARPGVSPSGATVAFVNLGGAPLPVGQRFAAAMSQALGARAIVSDEPARANYLIRGNMSAWQGEAGTIVAYVWDIYDSKRRRLQRLEDEITIKGAAADPWSLADEKTLASIAGRSADEIAAFLSNTPEAIAASGSAPLQPQAPAAAPSAALAYAPLR